MAALSEQATEVAEDVVELTMDVTEMAMEAARQAKARLGVFTATGVISGLAIGGVLGSLITKRRLSAQLDQKVNEIERELREHFRSKEIARQDKGELKDMTTALGYEAAEVVTPPVPPTVVVESDVPAPGVTVTTNSVFEAEHTQPGETWDIATEMALRDANPNDPWIVSFDEFAENATQAEQITLTMFDGDGVIVREDDSIVEDVDEMLGMSNLGRFGHGSNDQNSVYIYNPRTDTLYEVVVSFGTYAQTVAGFDPPDEPTLRHSRGRRGWDD